MHFVLEVEAKKKKKNKNKLFSHSNFWPEGSQISVKDVN